MLKYIAFFLLAANVSFANDFFRIEVGGKKDSEVSNSELKDRVLNLERAVSQLQNKFIELEKNSNVAAKQPEKKWTCRISAMGKTYVKTASTKGEAKGLAIEECSKGSNSSILCGDDDVKCED